MKTKGAKDKVKKRKRRSDYKKKHKKYRGKKIHIPFSKRPKSDIKNLKIYFWEQCKMSKSSYKNFSKKTRPYMRKIVYKPYLRVDIPVEDISSKDAISQMALEVIGETGTFIMRGFSKGKNRKGVKQVRLAVIKITEHSEGLRAMVFPTFRLHRYKWFYRDV